MLAAPGSQMRFGATSRSTAAGAAQQEQQVVVPIPSSREEAVSAAVKQSYEYAVQDEGW